MRGARHPRRRLFEHGWKMFYFRIFFSEMSLKHSACNTFRASEGSRKVPKMHLKSRKIDSMGDHISGKNHSKSVAGAVKVPSPLICLNFMDSIWLLRAP